MNNRILKPLFLFVLLIVTCLFAVSCGQRLESEAEANDYVDATAYRDSGQRLTFTGSVSAVGSYSLTVLPEDSSILSGMGTVRVAVSGSDPVLDEDGNRIALSDLTLGDMVRITYSGEPFGSDPARISQCYEVRRLG